LHRQANSSDCASDKLEPADLANGNLGQQAEFIIELDTANFGPWPDFSPVTMTGKAKVIQGSGASGKGKWVTTATDPGVATADPNFVVLPDNVVSNPSVRSDGHLLVTLPAGGVKWTELLTNVYEWDGENGKNFNTFSVACASSIGVGPNSRGLMNGTPWVTRCEHDAQGNHDVFQMQTDGEWVRMQTDIASRVAVSPEGIAWAINASGQILYWDANKNKFVANPGGLCATAIAVGPSSSVLPNGTPWITSCHPEVNGNYDVYQMQTAGEWTKMQDNVGFEVAVSPAGNAWAISAPGA
jgi:hypothetical protein